MNVSFTTDEKENVEFNQDGDVRAHYDIMNFQKMPNGSFSYVKIGDWDNHSLHFSNTFKPPGTGNGSSKFASVCSKACNPGFYKVIKLCHCTIDWFSIRDCSESEKCHKKFIDEWPKFCHFLTEIIFYCSPSHCSFIKWLAALRLVIAVGCASSVKKMNI